MKLKIRLTKEGFEFEQDVDTPFGKSTASFKQPYASIGTRGIDMCIKSVLPKENGTFEIEAVVGEVVPVRAAPRRGGQELKIAVIAILEKSKEPMSSRRVWEELRNMNMPRDLTTVYNVLSDMIREVPPKVVKVKLNGKGFGFSLRPGPKIELKPDPTTGIHVSEKKPPQDFRDVQASEKRKEELIKAARDK